MIVCRAPLGYSYEPRPWLFLSGSIELGTAELWQDRLAQELSDLPGTILNPRRENWPWNAPVDATFREQVDWELDGIFAADLLVFYFDPNTKSPITLIELGLFSGDKRGRDAVLCCPVGFWKKPNVDIVAERAKIKSEVEWQPFVLSVRALLASWR